MTDPSPAVEVRPARLEWLETLATGDDAFASRFGIPVVDGWVGFPEALSHAIDGARRALGHAYGGGSQFFSMWVVGSERPAN